MSDAGYTLFDTAIGRCALAWRDACITAFALPGADPLATTAALRRKAADAIDADPPPPIAAAIARIVAHLHGAADPLDDLPLNLAASSAFDRAIYAAARAIPPGQTRTYGQMAAAIGQPRAAQAVGVAMARNPCPVIVPCHRVMGAHGKLTGFSAPGGVATKVRLLEIERRAAGVASCDLFDDLPLAAPPP